MRTLHGKMGIRVFQQAAKPERLVFLPVLTHLLNILIVIDSSSKKTLPQTKFSRPFPRPTKSLELLVGSEGIVDLVSPAAGGGWS